MRGRRASPIGAWIAGLALALPMLALWSPRGAAARASTHAAAHAASAAEIRDIGMSSSAEGATLTIDLDRATHFALFTLAKPDRVVLDLSDTRLTAGAHLPPAGGIVQTVRSGLRPHGGLRLVLQLDPAAPGARVGGASSRARSSGVRMPAAHARWTMRRRGGASRLVVTIGKGGAAADGEAMRGARAGRHAAPADDDLRPVRVAHAPVQSDRDVVIAVDAGHGGQDPGAIGHGGTEEKTVTLAIARALAARIDAQPGMRAVLTRDRDEFLPLRERIRRARRAKADLFVSVHADSIRDPAVSGASVYVLSEHGATDEAARWLASRENAADLMGGISLADKDSTLASVLLDVAQSANISASMTAAQRVLTALDRMGEVRKAQVQQAGFVVLKSPDIKSMLIETAYISSPADERRLRTPAEQGRLADAILSGLRSYFEQYPPAGTRFAHERGGASSVLVGAAAGPAAAISP